MRLIKIYSNKESFRPVEFTNKSGLNIIVATKTEVEDDQDRTSNGVGKSLLIALIRFCLGSSIPLDFKGKLEGWEFTLNFSISETEYTVTRTVDKYNYVKFNNEEIKVAEFRNRMSELVFRIPRDAGGLTFGSLSPFFIRPNKKSYTDILNPNEFAKPYDLQINNAFLLGLNTSLAKDKKLNKDTIIKNKKDIDRLKKDKVIKGFLTGNNDPKISKDKLDKEIKELSSQLEKLEIAQDYYEIKTQADTVKARIDRIQNEVEISKVQIENIEKSLELRHDVGRDDIVHIYEESKLIFNAEISKTLEQLESFYNTISTNRSKRLIAQKHEIEKRKDFLLDEKSKLEKKLNDNLKYLDTHQALDVYKSVSAKLADSQIKLEKIESYNNLIGSLNLIKATLHQDRADNNFNTVTYLQSQEFKTIEEDNDNFFKAIAQKFYPEASAGISISNDEGDNQTRYKIDVRIESDGSDGIGNVKLFCYDLLLLMMQYNHQMRFVFHDSRLLNGIDPRQIQKLFKVAHNYFVNSNKQYIITVNYSDLDSIKDLFESPEEYKTIITDNIIHTLKDSSPEEKLLGIQLDLNYEKTRG